MLGPLKIVIVCGSSLAALSTIVNLILESGRCLGMLRVMVMGGKRTTATSALAVAILERNCERPKPGAGLCLPELWVMGG